ncbi:hypothetical protein MASR1M50_26370 [Burkholderiales bacterium]
MVAWVARRAAARRSEARSCCQARRGAGAGGCGEGESVMGSGGADAVRGINEASKVIAAGARQISAKASF